MITGHRLSFVGFCALATTACAHVPNSSPPIAYGCKDLVVDGTIVTQSYISQSGPDDMLGYGKFAGTLYVTTVLRGKARGRKINVVYFSHAEIRASQFRFVLYPVSDGFAVRSSAWREGNSLKLAKSCDPALD